MQIMKKLSARLLSIFALILWCSLVSNAQVVKSDKYYHNTFNNGEFGEGISHNSGNQSLTVSTQLPLSGAASLSSLANTNGSYKIQAGSANFALGDEIYGWEWTLLYQNTLGATDSNNSWKYWLTRESAQSTSSGCYLTQDGSKLSLVFSQNSDKWTFDVPGNLEANKIYAIRIQRLKQQSGWVVFVDDAATAPAGAYTKKMATGWYPSGGATYNSSLLEVKSSSNGRFKFDDLKMYSMKLLVSGANALENGITSPLVAGQENAVIYGLSFQTRGYFDIYQFKVEVSGPVISIIDKSTVKLNKSLDSYFGNAGDVKIADLSSGNVWDGAMQYYGTQSNPFGRFWSTGSGSGGIAEAGYMYITANVLNSPNTNSTFSFSGAPIITGASSEYNYAGDIGTVVSPTSSPVSPVKAYDWVGGSNAWATHTNWRLADDSTPDAAPGDKDFVRIGVRKTYSNMPTISNSTKIGNFIISGSQSVSPIITINANTTLTVAGNFINERESKFMGSGSFAIEGNWNTTGGKIDLLSENVTVKFSGSKVQSIKDNGSDSNNGVLFGNVVFSGGGTKTLGGNGKFAIAVGKYLTMEANTVLQASGKLALKSSALGSASINAVPATSSIQGNVTVERFVQGGDKAMFRTYRMWSSPVYDNSSDFINTNIVGSRTFSFTQFIDDIIITGKDGVGNGFDINTANTTSAWTYNNGFVAIPKINTSVNVGRGVYLVYRGNRSNYDAKVNSPYTDPESMVITYKGNLNQQDITVPLVHGSTGFSMLGNPYAATIDWQAVAKTGNVGDIVRVWNPEFKQYASYNGEFGVNGGGRYIGPGQAFFVQTTDNNSPSVTFKESSKVSQSSQSTPLYNTVMSVNEQKNVPKSANSAVSVHNGLGSLGVFQEQPSLIRMRLNRKGTNNSDETLLVLKSNELATISGKDVTKMSGEIVSLSSFSQESRKMAINYMPHVSEIQNVRLSVGADSTGTYTLSSALEYIPFGYQAKLKDKYLNSVVDLERQNTEYTFSIDKGNPSSFGDNRFELFFTAIQTLPVVFTEFNGIKTNQGVSLKWKTSYEQDNNRFEIRRAGEEQIFTTIGTVVPNSSGTYQLLDSSPLLGNNYYKLYQIDKDGKSAAHNKVVVVKHQLNENISNQLSVYPTVVETSYTVKFTGDLTTDRFAMKLTDITGKEVSSKVLSKAEIFNGYSSDFPSTSAGIYFATLVDLVNGNQLGMVKIIKK